MHLPFAELALAHKALPSLSMCCTNSVSTWCGSARCAGRWQVLVGQEDKATAGTAADAGPGSRERRQAAAAVAEARRQ